MKIPGPDHPISIARSSRGVLARFGDQIIASSRDALILKESDYPEVTYIPRQDVNMSLFTRTDRRTHCPYKGEASYFSLKGAGAKGENIAWSYEQPFSSVATIKDHLAFYPIVEIEDGGM